MEKLSKVIVILGMHKSGTSMVAGVLEKLGVNMGKELLGPHWSNPLGHFENVKFVNLNERILKEAKGSWDNPPKEENILSLKEKFFEEIEKLIEKEESEIWGWKDPRTSLTIELYLPYLKNPHFFVCHRNIKAIAEELKERDNMEIVKGEKLAKLYEKRIDEFFQKYPKSKKLDIYYEEFVSAPTIGLKKMINFLEIKPTQKQFQEALNFIRHPKDMEILALKMHIKELKMHIKELHDQLNYIYNLQGWKLLNKCYRIADKILPMGSRRRKVVERILKWINKM